MRLLKQKKDFRPAMDKNPEESFSILSTPRELMADSRLWESYAFPASYLYTPCKKCRTAANPFRAIQRLRRTVGTDVFLHIPVLTLMHEYHAAVGVPAEGSVALLTSWFSTPAGFCNNFASVFIVPAGTPQDYIPQYRNHLQFSAVYLVLL